MRPHLEKTHYIKWACEVAEDVGLEFQLQYHKKKKKKKEEEENYSKSY
jgi:hypothetical protein